MPLQRLVLCFVLLVNACAPSEPIIVTNAWIRAPVPGTATAVGYFDILNRSGTSIALVGVRSTATATIEMHTTQHDGELMQMRQLDRVDLPEGTAVSFAAGGRHLMLPRFGDVTTPSIPVTLVFSNASELTVQFELRSAGATRE